MTISPTLSAGRRESNRRHRRSAILDIARQSFLEQGYDATTMSAIAAAMGGSKGTLWSYFPSKELLFAAMIDEAADDFRSQLPEILNPRDCVQTALTRFCREFVQKVVSPEAIALHRIVIAAAARLPEVGRIFNERAPARTRQMLAAFLSDAMAQGRLKRCDPMVAAHQLTQLCLCGCHHQLMLHLIEEATPEQLEQDVENAVSTFMRAFGADRRDA